MKICPRCGVELDEPVTVCPLCREALDQPPAPNANGISGENDTGEPFYTDYAKLTKDQKRKLFWELSGIILLSGVLVTLMVDFVTSNSITWSRYTVTVFLVLFVNTTLFSFWRHRIVLLLGGSFISTSALLVLLDIYNKGIGWGTQLGAPLLLSFYLIVFVLILIIRATQHRGFNMLGLGFLAAGVMSVCIEVVLSRYFFNAVSVGWSLIVLACMIPVASILFFLHYRLKKGMDLRRFFHI